MFRLGQPTHKAFNSLAIPSDISSYRVGFVISASMLYNRNDPASNCIRGSLMKTSSVLLFSFLFTLLVSCKTASRSQLDSATFEKHGQVFVVYFENDMFYLNVCRKNEDIDRIVAKKDIGVLKQACKEATSAITPMALKDTLLTQMLGPASEDLAPTKETRIRQLVNRIEFLVRSIIDVEDQLADAGMDTSPRLEAQKKDLEAVLKEKDALAENLRNPEALKKIDIEATLALAGKMYTTADEHAAVYTAILRDNELYRLDIYRDVILTRTILNFAPTCTTGAKMGEEAETVTGLEKITYVCQADGSSKVVSVGCALEGYERKDNYCIFTGKDVKLSSFVATHFGICGVSRNKILTCWGKPGAFPMVTGGRSVAEVPRAGSPDVPIGPISSRIYAEKVAASSRHLCSMKGKGSILNCWPRSYDVPANDKEFKQVIGGDGHFCGITSNGGRVECWGDSAYRRLDVPAGIENAKSIATSEHVTCAIGGNDDLYCWGEFLTNNGTANPNPPSDLKKAIAVSVANSHACVITPEKNVRCWGQDESGQTVVPSDLGQVRLIKVGDRESCAVKLDGAMRCWGRDNSGRPYKQGPALTDVQTIVTGRYGSNFCAIYQKDKVDCWGSLRYAGDYTIDPPANLGAVTDIAITASGYACGILPSGAVRCWGNTAEVPTGVPDAFTTK